MEVPSTWMSSKRQRQHRTRNDITRKKVRWNYDTDEPVSLQDLCNEICQNVLSARTPTDSESINFETILTYVPYKTILETLYDNVTPENCNIPIVSKKHEESFLRECIHKTERRCVMGHECECRNIDKDNQFVGVEFLVMGQTTNNCTPQMCVLCSRKYTQKLYYDLIFRPRFGNVGFIQRYGVINGLEGEYSNDYVLIMPPNGPVQSMPFPSVVHCRNNYKVVVRNAVRYIIQRSEMGFQKPSLETTSSA